MLKKSSILTLSLLAAAIVAVPARADCTHVDVKSDVDGPSSDVDRTPDHRQVFFTGESFVLKVDKSSVFDQDTGETLNFGHPVHNTAEWVWWLKDKDKNKFEIDPGPNVAAPEPASFFLLGSGMLALVAWRRRTSRSATLS
jgi:PEP-CTERM motif